LTTSGLKVATIYMLPTNFVHFLTNNTVVYDRGRTKNFANLFEIVSILELTKNEYLVQRVVLTNVNQI